VVAATEIRVVDATVDEADRWYDLLVLTLPQLDLVADLAEIEQAAGEEWAEQAETAEGSERVELTNRSIEVLQQSAQLKGILAIEGR
jgi:hypothetical protein